jgi:hypothetical protein
MVTTSLWSCWCGQVPTCMLLTRCDTFPFSLSPCCTATADNVSAAALTICRLAFVIAGRFDTPSLGCQEWSCQDGRVVGVGCRRRREHQEQGTLRSNLSHSVPPNAISDTSMLMYPLLATPCIVLCRMATHRGRSLRQNKCDVQLTAPDSTPSRPHHRVSDCFCVVTAR